MHLIKGLGDATNLQWLNDSHTCRYMQYASLNTVSSQVRASDLGVPQRRTTVRVSVDVMEVHSDSAINTLTAPSSMKAQVTETDPPGYLVAVIQPPIVDRSLIWFSIVGEL